LSFSTKFDKIETAVSRYPPPLSLKSIINEFIFFDCNSLNAVLNSSQVFSQKIDNITYQIFLSNTFESTEGILIFFLITSFFIISFSPGLIISSETMVHAGHLILFTASNRLRFFNSMSFALIIISPDKIQASLAGAQAINLSTITQKSLFWITAQIHSKSQLRVSLNFFVSSRLKYSECLSPRDVTNHLIIQEIKSDFGVLEKE
jgi:hypothetical protein